MTFASLNCVAEKLESTFTRYVRDVHGAYTVRALECHSTNIFRHNFRYFFSSFDGGHHSIDRIRQVRFSVVSESQKTST